MSGHFVAGQVRPSLTDFVLIRPAHFTTAGDRIFRFLKKRQLISLSPSLNTLLLALSSGMIIYHRDQQPQMVINFLFALSK